MSTDINLGEYVLEADIFAQWQPLHEKIGWECPNKEPEVKQTYD
jgi:hypothetical protein